MINYKFSLNKSVVTLSYCAKVLNGFAVPIAITVARLRQLNVKFDHALNSFRNDTQRQMGGCYLLVWHFLNKKILYVQLLLLRGYVFNQSADFETIRMMKEKLCYIA